MTTRRLMIPADEEPRRSSSNDDYTPPALDRSPSGHIIISPRARPRRNHNNARDSAIGMGEDADAATQAPDQEAQCLQDKLFSALIPTNQGKGSFFAKEVLERILTEDCVGDELRRCFEDSLSEECIAAYARTICHGTVVRNDMSGHDRRSRGNPFTKVLAILILIQKTDSIIQLLEENVNDSDLPLIHVPRRNDEQLFDLRVKRNRNTVLRCFQKGWNQLNIRNFEEWQWTTLPVDFARPEEDPEVKHYHLEDQEILPFVKDTPEQETHFPRRTELEGGFACVSQVAIHPQHHNFHTLLGKSNPALFAVKRLHSQNKQAFQREVEMLKKFSGNKHDHLISLLATYKQSDRFFLVFDWAEADLQRYWKTVNHSPSFDFVTVSWMAKQCKGIANGIIKIHEHESIYTKNDSADRAGKKNIVFGHHGDIRPENVLWFAEPRNSDRNVGGILRLSDFGLAEVNIHRTISMAPRSKWGVSLAYRAPEADLKQGAAIGRSYDIWTLGCLYLEFITWILGGRRLLDEFVEVRRAPDATWHDIETHTFFKLEIDRETGEPRAIIKPSVTRFMRSLHSHPKCSQFIHDFLDMVEGSLLVVKTSDRQNIGRFSIQQVHQGLANMLSHCVSKDYAIKPVTR